MSQVVREPTPALCSEELMNSRTQATSFSKTCGFRSLSAGQEVTSSNDEIAREETQGSTSVPQIRRTVFGVLEEKGEHKTGSFLDRVL